MEDGLGAAGGVLRKSRFAKVALEHLDLVRDLLEVASRAAREIVGDDYPCTGRDE